MTNDQAPMTNWENALFWSLGFGHSLLRCRRGFIRPNRSHRAVGTQGNRAGDEAGGAVGQGEGDSARVLALEADELGEVVGDVGRSAAIVGRNGASQRSLDGMGPGKALAVGVRFIPRVLADHQR